MAASEQNRCFVRIGTDLYYCFCNQHECYMGKRYGIIKSSDFQKGFDPEGMSCFVSSNFAKATVGLAVVVYHWYVFDVVFFWCLQAEFFDKYKVCIFLSLIVFGTIQHKRS